MWNEEGALLAFTIRPPLLRTWFAYLLYAATSLGLLFTFWRYSLAQERLKAELKGKQYEKEKLEELDQFKTRFFTNVSHEFRTPLTLILGTLEQLLQKPKTKPGRKGSYRLMHRNAQRLLQLINQLLDIARLEAGTIRQELKSTDLVQDLSLLVANFSSPSLRSAAKAYLLPGQTRRPKAHREGRPAHRVSCG